MIPSSMAEPSSHVAMPAKPPRRLWVSLVSGSLLGLTALPFLIRWTARLDWRIDLLTHFQLAWVALSALLTALLWPIRRRFALLALLLTTLQLLPILPYYLPNPGRPDPQSFERLRLVSVNVLVDNRNYEALEHLLTIENPDVIGLIEYTPTWQARLSWLAHRYPYRFEAPDGPQGLALWSRVPFHAARLERHISGGWPCVHARLEFAGRDVGLWLVHPSSPVRRMRQGGFPELVALSEHVATEGGTQILFGDLNTTSGSPLFADFLTRTGLRDTRLGFGLQGSWPSGSPYRIAIDHALVSPDLAVTSRRLGPDVGSDHLPVVLDLAPARTNRHASTVSKAAAP